MRADSDDTRRELQLEMSPQATHIVAWLPLTLPLPVLEQDGQGLGPGAAALGEERREKRAPLQGSLGQGQGDKARGQSADLASSSAPVNGPSARCHALGQALSALRPSIGNTRPLPPALWTAVSAGTGDRDELGGVNRACGGAPTMLQTPTEAGGHTRGACGAAEARADARRRVACPLQALVAGHRH